MATAGVVVVDVTRAAVHAHVFAAVAVVTNVRGTFASVDIDDIVVVTDAAELGAIAVVAVNGDTLVGVVAGACAFRTGDRCLAGVTRPVVWTQAAITLTVGTETSLV